MYNAAMNQTKGEFSKVLFALALATVVSAVAAAEEGPRPIECVAHRGEIRRHKVGSAVLTE